MNNITFNLDGIGNDVSILKDKMDNLRYTHDWFIDSYFNGSLKSKEEMDNFLYAYNEMKIKSEITKELMEKHSQEMNEILKEIELLKNEIKGVSDHEEK